MKNIEENNRLIALFMAAGTPEEEVLKHDLQKAGTIESMQYHEDWNWLMEVVEKIESFENGNREAKYNVNVVQCFVEIVDNENSDEIVNVDGADRKDAIYKAVVEFIKWYNENNPA